MVGQAKDGKDSVVGLEAFPSYRTQGSERSKGATSIAVLSRFRHHKKPIGAWLIGAWHLFKEEMFISETDPENRRLVNP